MGGRGDAAPVAVLSLLLISLAQPTPADGSARILDELPAFYGYVFEPSNGTVRLREVFGNGTLGLVEDAFQSFVEVEAASLDPAALAVSALDALVPNMTVTGRVDACRVVARQTPCLKLQQAYEAFFPDGSAAVLPGIPEPPPANVSRLRVNGTSDALTVAWDGVGTRDPVVQISVTAVRLGTQFSPAETRAELQRACEEGRPGADPCTDAALAAAPSAVQVVAAPTAAGQEVVVGGLEPYSDYCTCVVTDTAHRRSVARLLGQTATGCYTQPLLLEASAISENRVSTRWVVPPPYVGPATSIRLTYQPADGSRPLVASDEPVTSEPHLAVRLGRFDQIAVRFSDLEPNVLYNLTVTASTATCRGTFPASTQGELARPPFQVPEAGDMPTPRLFSTSSPSQVLVVWDRFADEFAANIASQQLIAGFDGSNLGLILRSGIAPNVSSVVLDASTVTEPPNIRLQAVLVVPSQGLVIRSPVSLPASDQRQFVPGSSDASGLAPGVLTAILVIAVLAVAIVALLIFFRRRMSSTAPIQPARKARRPKADQWELPPASVSLGDHIGRGAYGLIVKGTVSSTRSNPEPQSVAVKTSKADTSYATWYEITATDALIHEAAIMKLVCVQGHANIIRLIGVCMQAEPLQLIMEYAPNGNLKTYLRQQRPTVTTEEPGVGVKDQLRMATEVATGMDYLHDLRILHCDLSARNVLVDDNATMKISDFGMSQDLGIKDYFRREGDMPLPVRWVPPECLLDGVFSIAGDVWMYGVLVWEIFSLGGVPYHNLKRNEVYRYVTEGNHVEQPPGCPDVVYDLIMEICFADERPAFSDLVEALERVSNLTAQDPETLTCRVGKLQHPNPVTVLEDKEGGMLSSLSSQVWPHGFNTAGSDGRRSPSLNSVSMFTSDDLPLAQTRGSPTLLRSTLALPPGARGKGRRKRSESAPVTPNHWSSKSPLAQGRSSTAGSSLWRDGPIDEQHSDNAGYMRVSISPRLSRASMGSSTAPQPPEPKPEMQQRPLARNKNGSVDSAYHSQALSQQGGQATEPALPNPSSSGPAIVSAIAIQVDPSPATRSVTTSLV